MLRLLRTLLLAIVGLVALAAAVLATPPGHLIVAGLIERAAASGGLTVKLSNISGWPPFWLGADKITLADADGPFAEIDGLSVNVGILRLLTGTLALDAASADRVAIARMPKLPPSAGGSAAAAFAADTFAIARVELGEALAGRAAVLAANGSFASDSAGGLSARVVANRIDGVTGEFTATVARASAGALPVVKLALKEGADGILAGLMGRREGPGYQVDAETTDTGGILDGSVRLASEGAAHFDGQFTVSPMDGGAQKLVLTGSGDLAELTPPDYADLLGGSVAVIVDGDFAAADGAALPRMTIRRGTLTTNTIRAEASGSIGGDAADLALTVDVAKVDGGSIRLPGLGQPAEAGALTLKGRVAPKDDRLRLDLTGRITALKVGTASVPGVGLSLAVEAPKSGLAAAKLPFAFRAEADGIATPGGTIGASAAAPMVLTIGGAYDAESGGVALQAALTAAGAKATFDGSAGDGAQVEGKASLAVPNLAALSPLLGRALGGAIDATADGRFGVVASQFTLSGTTRDLNPGDAIAARLLAGETRFGATVERDGARIALSDVTLDGEAANAKGNLLIAADAIEGTFDGAIADLARLAAQSSGAATFHAELAGSPAAPTLEATLGVANGVLLGQPVQDAKATVTGAPSADGWKAALILGGTLAGKALDGTATATLDAAGALAFPSIALTVADNRITGALERSAGGPLSGVLAVDAPDLTPLAALALIEASGKGTARVEFMPDGAQQIISVAFDGAGISYGPLNAQSVTGQARIDDATGAPRVTGRSVLSGARVGSLRLDRASVTASVADGATRFDADLAGPDLTLKGGGRLAGAAGAQAVVIETLTGTAYRLPVSLAQPVTVALGGAEQGRVDADLALGGGHVRVKGTASPTLDLNVVIDAVSAAALSAVAPTLGAEGTISANASITGEPAAPKIDWNGTWSGLRVSATRSAGLPGLSFSGRGAATLSESSIEATLSGAGLSLAISGSVPFAGPGLAVAARGTAPLSLLALESDRELRLAGAANVDVTISGAVTAPQFAGTADLSGATFADPATGFGVTGASGRITFDGARATTSGISGRMQQGGDIVIAGTVGLTGALPADLTIKVNNGRYADGNLINTAFGTGLTLKGPLLGDGVLAGRIDLGRTEIRLPDKFGTGAAAIDVKHVNTAPGFKAPKLRSGGGSTAAGRSGGNLQLDIALAGNSGIFVRGFGIDAELGGTAEVRGTTGTPVAAGGFTMNRGRIEVLGRRFDFTSGTLTFAGDLIPTLDFAATTSTSDAVVTLHVTGKADDPTISFTSSPSLPEEEILSRLLFDRNVGSLSPLQAAQLVDAVAQLTGALGGTGLFARVREATGLDDLDIRQSASGGTTVGVSKRLGDRVRLGVEAGTDDTSGRVTIDLDITKNLKARGEAGQDGSGKVGLTYEREY